MVRTLIVSAVTASVPLLLQAQVIDLRATRMIDLSHPFNAQTLYWPTSTSVFQLQKLSFGMTPGGFFYASNELSTPEHGGTHLDAPIHFGEGKHFNHEIPLQKLIAP